MRIKVKLYGIQDMGGANQCLNSIRAETKSS